MKVLLLFCLGSSVAFSQGKQSVTQQSGSCSINNTGNNSTATLVCNSIDPKLAEQIKDIVDDSRRNKAELDQISKGVSLIQSELHKPDPNEGWLVPGNEPSPPNNKCLETAPSDTLFIFFGTAAVSFAPAGAPEHIVVRSGNQNLLTINQSSKGATISAELFDQDGILAEIDHGKFEVKRPGFLKPPQHDAHDLIVYDKWNQERLHVRYLNSHAISITGNLFYPTGSLLADGTTLRVGSFVFQGGSCVGGNFIDFSL
jgi:hypothetical protein